jgi:hypothetical protein
MSEEKFWRSTPRKVGTLWKLHSKFNGWEVKEENKREERLFIDQIQFL